VYETITFLTDFGLRDDFVGVCRGVMKRIAPDASVIDVTHGIPPQAVKRGALVLARALPYLPAGVHLAVVDPGVGGPRRAVAIRTRDGGVLVGPDNGLLTLAADRAHAEAARSLTNPRYHLERVSRTFHARDIFAPVAAHLAAGVHFDDLGEEVDPASLVRLDLPPAVLVNGELRATVVDIDRFGNLELNFGPGQIATLGLSPGVRVELWFALNAYFAVVAETYAAADRGELILYEDSYGAYAIAISGGNAASLTEAASGDEVGIRLVETG
jgi:S-adenosyl-L-methionine hydrolase (adenosine-forming)